MSGHLQSVALPEQVSNEITSSRIIWLALIARWQEMRTWWKSDKPQHMSDQWMKDHLYRSGKED